MILPELSDNQLKTAELIVSIFGFAAVAITLLFGFIQYRRAERWRRGEFVAKEIKDFLSDPAVRNTLLMIDWGRRRINVYQLPNQADSDGELITRGIQWRALLPDKVKWNHPEYRAAAAQQGDAAHGVAPAEPEDYQAVFTALEAKIRETYDIFLGYLARFSNFLELKLIKPGEIEPYLAYWLDSITSNADPEYDATWRCALLTYINYYRYSGVIKLFAAFGEDITPDGKLYQELLDSVRKLSSKGGGQGPSVDRAVLADRLYASVKKTGRLEETAPLVAGTDSGL